jgi:hypothetical protein
MWCASYPGWVWAQNDITTKEICSPVIIETADNAQVNVVCNITLQEAKTIASDNLETVIRKVESIIFQKNEFLFPAIQEFRDNPSASRWAAVQDQAEFQLELIKAAAKSVVAFGEQARMGDIPNLHNISGVLRARGGAIREIMLEAPPSSQSELDNWQNRYISLYSDTLHELNALRDWLQRSA